MIVDTTYLLPLAGIGVDTDFVRLIAENKVPFTFDEIAISSISLFEIQAKVAKSGLRPKFAIDAIGTINASFKVEQFYNPRIIEISSSLSGFMKDYIDCIILATAIVLKDNLATEDSRIRKIRGTIKERFGINVFNYKDLVALQGR